MSLFEPKDFGKLASHQVAGFDRPIPAICYRGSELHSPFPIGGLATGYLELRGDGKLGQFSILNNFVPVGQTPSPALLTLIDAAGKETPLDADHADISILAHFPVCNVRYTVKNTDAIVWLRLYTPIIPGDADTSNTPGTTFEISADHWTGQVRLDLAIAPNVEPIVKSLDLPANLNGAAKQYFKGDDYRASFVLAWTDAGDGKGEAASDRTRLTLTGSIPEGKTRRALFAWHLPWWIDTGGEPHMNRYATRHKDALAVATFLTDAATRLNRILDWQSALYSSDDPDWLKNALVQSLYSYVKNTVWVDEHRDDRWYEPNGFFVHSESFIGCPIAETMVCRQHGHIATLLLWPELEKSTLAGFAHFQNRQGEVPFSFGSPNSLRDPRFHCQHPLTSSQFVQMIHRYFVRTGDEAFVKRFWPNVVDAMNFVSAFLDSDNDGLVNDHAHALPGDNWPANQFYDQWPWHGTSSYVAGTGLASLRSAAALADRMNDQASHEEWMKRLDRGLASFRQKLWNGSYFRLWHDDKLGENETCLANQLMGQYCCRLAGLDPLFTADECKSVYAALDKFNASPTNFGLINGGNFQGDPTVAGDPNNNHGTMIFVSENLCASMTGMYENHAAADEWAKTLVQTIHEHQAMPFDQFCLIRHDNGAPAWGNNYYSNLVVWALPIARRRFGLGEMIKPGGIIDNMLKAAQNKTSHNTETNPA